MLLKCDLQRAQVLLERPGCIHHDEAIEALRALIGVDRAFPALDSWLIRAHANKERAERVSAAAATAAAAGNMLSAGGDSKHATAFAVSQSNHYATLEVSLDFSAAELKKAYRRQSRAHHPDKHGGSNAAFQRVAAAHEVLSNAARRTAYDEGEDVPKAIDNRGEEGPSLKERITRQYFPDRFQFHPFGDPFEGKRAHEQEKLKNAPPPPNADGIPEGTYLGSCHGCALVGGELVCQQCVSSVGDRLKSAIAVDACAEEEVIGNRDGALACEPKPAVAGSVAGDGALPAGGYIDSCSGCELIDSAATLHCTGCLDGHGQRSETFIDVVSCGPGQTIANRLGVLACERNPADATTGAKSNPHGEL